MNQDTQLGSCPRQGSESLLRTAAEFTFRAWEAAFERSWQSHVGGQAPDTMAAEVQQTDHGRRGSDLHYGRKMASLGSWVTSDLPW